jgi:O-acetyl-ADP-ribose deacetylase (regulator of RNase III)
MLRSFLNGRVQVYVGDITTHEVDAVVNAANSSLMGGGGVDGAIHRAGGDAILEACISLRRSHWPDGLPTGKAVLTTAGNLPARNVIHTVGPIYGETTRPAEQLASCYRNSLEIAAKQGLTSLAFPAISTGVYSYPREEAAMVVSQTLHEELEKQPSIREVRLVFFQAEDAEVFLAHQRFETA